MNVSFIQCGYNEAFDYCQLMILKLNSKQCIAKNFCWVGSEIEDIKRTEEIASLTMNMDNRLKLFFDAEYRDVSFMSSYLFDSKSNQIVNSLEEVVSLIKSDQDFENKIVRFYLGQSFQTREETMHALMTGYNELESSYKERLMYFLLFKTEHMDLLFDSMKSVHDSLYQVYKDRSMDLEALKEKFDFDLVAEHKRTLKKWAEPLEKIQIWFSYCNPYTIMGGKEINRLGWMILGCNYFESLLYRWNIDIPIEKIANALGDEMRIRIIEEVKKAGEIGAPQLSKKMNLPSSAVFYHLDILRKASLLCSRMKGRTAYYWVNQKAFERMIEDLKKLGGITL